MAPSSPSNSSSSEEDSPTTTSLFLSINAKEEPNSPMNDSPLEGTTSATTPLKNKSSPSRDSSTRAEARVVEKNSSKQLQMNESSPPLEAKQGNSTVKNAVVCTTSPVNSSAIITQTTLPPASSTPTTNTSTPKPVLVQSKKAIHPHQPMNSFGPPQLIHHHPQMFDPNLPYHQPPVRVANVATAAGAKQVYSSMIPQGTVPTNSLQFYNSFPPGHHHLGHQTNVFYPPPAGHMFHHDPTAMYMPMPPQPTPEAESSESDADGYSSEEEEDYRIITMQKPSPYTEMKQKYEDLVKLYNKACKELISAQTELADLKRKRVDTRSLPSQGNGMSTITVGMTSPATKKKKTESPITDPQRQNVFSQSAEKTNSSQKGSYQQLETSITSLPPSIPLPSSSSPSSDTSSVSLNTLVYIYYYDGGCDGHGSRQLKANGKRIFIDINWDEIFKFRKDDCLHMCIFVNTSTVDKVKDSDLIATFKILRTDGDRVKISKIRENLRRLNLQNQFSHIGHIKFFIQIRGSDQQFDYTDKILLYSKTQHNIANFEPSNQKEYNELSKLFYQPERFTVFKKV